MLALSRSDVRLFRNNVGNFWQGRIVEQDRRKDFVTLWHPRRIQCGLAPGAPDLIGWRSIVITPEMVGRRIAVFAGIEDKSARDKPTDEQDRFIDAIDAAGGLAGVARDVDSAAKILNQHFYAY